jgi:hypothetical protein
MVNVKAHLLSPPSIQAGSKLKRSIIMSILGDLAKSVEGSVLNGVSQKFGLDPAMAQGFLDKLQGQEPSAAQEGAEEPPQAQAAQDGATEGASDVASDQTNPTPPAESDANGLLASAMSMLDKDGDGNLMNEAQSMVSGLFRRT